MFLTTNGQIAVSVSIACYSVLMDSAPFHDF
jgi:hypothetical protein